MLTLYNKVGFLNKINQKYSNTGRRRSASRSRPSSAAKDEEDADGKKKDKSGAWMAKHMDGTNDDIKKLITATEYFSNKDAGEVFDEIDQAGQHVYDKISLVFYYPVLVLQGGIVDVVDCQNCSQTSPP